MSGPVLPLARFLTSPVCLEVRPAVISSQSAPGPPAIQPDSQTAMDSGWKNSLRPLDPGILSDVKAKKKERFDETNCHPTDDYE